MKEGEAAALLREVCVLMLVYGEPDPDLAGWCLRMLAEPGAVALCLGEGVPIQGYVGSWEAPAQAAKTGVSWAFGFAGYDPWGNEADGTVGASLRMAGCVWTRVRDIPSNPDTDHGTVVRAPQPTTASRPGLATIYSCSIRAR